MIKLTDFLNIDEPSFSQYKIHFATDAKEKKKTIQRVFVRQF